MKARIIATGEIINIAEYARVKLDRYDSFGDPLELPFDEVQIINETTIEELEARHDILLEQSDMPSEERMRYELAKAAIPTAYKTLIDSNRLKIDNDDIAFQSVNIANAILKKVKQNEQRRKKTQ